MFCPQCGKEQFAESKFCAFCGASLTPAAEPAPEPAPFTPTPAPFAEEPAPFQPQTAPVQAAEPVEIRAEKKRSKKAPILIGAGALVLALLVGLGLWLLLRGDKKPVEAPNNPLSEVKSVFRDINLGPVVDSSDKTESELDSFLAPLPNLSKVISNGRAMLSAPVLGVDADVRANGTNISLNGTLDRNGKRAGLQANVSSQGKSLNLGFYLDTEQVQAACRELLGEDAVYALPLKNFTERWNSSALSRLTGFRIPSYVDSDKILSNFSDFSDDGVQAKLKELYGDNWTRFSDSIQLTEKTGGVHFTEGGTPYGITWDSELLGRMAGQAKKYFDDLDLELDDEASAAKLLDLNLNEAMAHGLVCLFYSIDTEVDDLELLMDTNDCLVGLYVKNEEANSGKEVEYRLCGENNIWEHITVQTRNWYTGYYDDSVEETTSGMDIRLTVDGSRLTAAVHREFWAYTVGQSDKYGSGMDFSLVYDDDTGAIQVYDEDGNRQISDQASVTIRPAGSGVTLQITEGRNNASVTIRPEGAVNPLSQNPTDLLGLTEEELKAIVEDIDRRGSALFGN